MNEIRISLTAEDFEKLVNGEIIEPKQTNLSVLAAKLDQPLTLKICLQDIGFHKMVDIISQAMQK